MASRIGKGGWGFLYAAAGAIDISQFLLDFTGIGELVNEFADPAIGILFALYFQIRGVSMISRPSRLASLIGAAVIEEVTFGAAPAWILDVWYIHRTVRQEEASMRAVQERESALIDISNQPFNQEISGVPTRPPSTRGNAAPERPFNAGDIRPPRGNIRPLRE